MSPMDMDVGDDLILGWDWISSHDLRHLYVDGRVGRPPEPHHVERFADRVELIKDGTELHQVVHLASFCLSRGRGAAAPGHRRCCVRCAEA